MVKCQESMLTWRLADPWTGRRCGEHDLTLDCLVSTVISPGRWKQVFAPAMKRCHAWNVNAMKAIFMPYLGKLWEVKIWRSFEDGSWRLWRFIYFYILMQPPCFLRVFCMDISHLRFVWRQVLCQRGSWQGQGWKSIQTCLMVVLWCPMLAKCWQMYTFAGVENGESEFHPLVSRRRDWLNMSDPQMFCPVFFVNISMLPNTIEF